MEENTKHIKSIIQNLRQERKLKKGLEKAQIKKLWQELMGDTIANYTHHLTYDSGQLKVYLTSSTLREELNRGKQKIINLLNEHLGKEVVKNIIFK